MDQYLRNTNKGYSNMSANDISDALPTNECGHLEAGVIPNTEGKLNVIEFTYCPKCGKKL